MKCFSSPSRVLKSELDEILSPENIVTYLTDLRTKVLWSNEESELKSIKHIKHRAYNAIINKIPRRRTPHSKH